jgi:Na+/melibiose symporter-like transporter
MGLGLTMLTASHLAWGPELSTEYHERSRIQGGASLPI